MSPRGVTHVKQTGTWSPIKPKISFRNKRPMNIRMYNMQWRSRMYKENNWINRSSMLAIEIISIISIIYREC